MALTELETTLNEAGKTDSTERTLSKNLGM